MFPLCRLSFGAVVLTYFQALHIFREHAFRDLKQLSDWTLDAVSWCWPISPTS